MRFGIKVDKTQPEGNTRLSDERLLHIDLLMQYSGGK